ncbi:MAG: hypothetical protein LBQ27_01480 [Clostridiales bacterium]|jgi:CRISPR-associated protein Cst1|nr:hypothetical protein [Clostridiales bacterium]
MKELRVKLDTALFNAGVLGFKKILDAGNINYRTDGDELTVDAQSLLEADLAELYIDAAIEKFGKTTRIYKSIEAAGGLLGYNVAEGLSELPEKAKEEADETVKREKEFWGGCKNFCESFLQASIKTGLRTLEKQNVHTDIAANAEALKKEKNIDVAKELIQKILRDFEKPKVAQTLYMKAIIYTKINMIWSGVAFLNVNRSDVPAKIALEESFVEPLYEMARSASDGKKTCACCNVKYNKMGTLSFLNDIGIDSNRKKSAFWNMQFDLATCPLCIFVYACAPLGFKQLGQDLIFINQNKSIEDMDSGNAKLESDENINGNYRYKLINDLVLSEIEIKESEISNLEVLIRHSGDKGYYSLDVIDKRTIKIFKRCKEELKAIKYSKAKIGEEYVDIAWATIGCLFSKQALWGLILKLLKAEYNGYPLWRLLMIQVKRKEINKMDEENYIKKLRWIYYEGKKINQEYNKDDSKNENKLRGTLLKMQNAIRLEDRHTFFDILLRLYNGMNRSVPDIFLDAMSNDEILKEIGIAFILGATGTPNDKEDKNVAGESESAAE